MDIQIRKQLEQLEYIKDKLEYIEYDEALGCYIEKQDGLPTGVAAWVNGAFYGFEQAKAHEAKKIEGCVVVPHGVLDLTRFMCKTWYEIDKFVYKNCSDIGQYPVIQGTQNQLNLSRIGEQQINANEINKGVKWLLEAAQEPAND